MRPFISITILVSRSFSRSFSFYFLVVSRIMLESCLSRSLQRLNPFIILLTTEKKWKREKEPRNRNANKIREGPPFLRVENHKEKEDMDIYLIGKRIEKWICHASIIQYYSVFILFIFLFSSFQCIIQWI